MSRNYNCEFQIRHDLDIAPEYQKKCKRRCEEIDYQLYTSFSEFPTKEAKAWFFTTFLYNNPKRHDLLAWKYFIENIRDPNKSAEESKYKKQTFLGKESINPKKTSVWISSSFARVNIYFDSVTILRKIQKPSYTMDQLLADIGGRMGLWVGLSVLTIVEFLTKVRYFIHCTSNDLPV